MKTLVLILLIVGGVLLVGFLLWLLIGWLRFRKADVPITPGD